MSNSPVKFNMGILGVLASMMQSQNQGTMGVTPRGMFGSMGNNPSVNSLSNANALSRVPMGMFGARRNPFGSFSGDVMGNVIANTLARKAARRRSREVARLNNIDPNISVTETGPDSFGNFDPISQMGGLAAGAGSAIMNKVDPRIQKSLDEGAENYDTRKYLGHKQKKK